jgi:hypothetical protein
MGPADRVLAARSSHPPSTPFTQPSVHTLIHTLRSHSLFTSSFHILHFTPVVKRMNPFILLKQPLAHSLRRLLDASPLPTRLRLDPAARPAKGKEVQHALDVAVVLVWAFSSGNGGSCKSRSCGSRSCGGRSCGGGGWGRRPSSGGGCSGWAGGEGASGGVGRGGRSRTGALCWAFPSSCGSLGRRLCGRSGARGGSGARGRCGGGGSRARGGGTSLASFLADWWWFGVRAEKFPFHCVFACEVDL